MLQASKNKKLFLKKQLADTLGHLLESLPLCCNPMVGILLNNASQSMPNLYKKPTKRPRPSIMSHCAAQLLYWSYTRLVPVLHSTIPKLLRVQLASFRWRASFNSAANACQSKNFTRSIYFPNDQDQVLKHYQWGLFAPNSYQMLLYGTPKCCKPFNEIDSEYKIVQD